MDSEEKIAFEDIENSELGSYIKNKPEQGCSDLLADGDPAGNISRYALRAIAKQSA